ncbi:hypothetical protein L6R53_06350 [Myxococcota bacterium]|nr:hypothetical protein [Myxococcota bacterium]
MVRWTSRLVLLAPLLAACSSKWTYVDQDGDGVSAAEGDCWDSSASPPGSNLSGADIFPGAAETWYDGFDQDCGGDHDFDQDADGFVADEWAAQAGDLAVGDCDDARAEVNPLAADEFYDGVDSDCGGQDDFDQDGDGYVPPEYAGQATQYVEGSGGLPGGDCDDLLDVVNPEAGDDWYDGVDSDCGGEDDYDQDGDGYVPLAYEGLETRYVDGSGGLEAGDCDDTDPGRVPDDSVPVIWYNGYDERCDENDGDQDGDGFWAEDYEDRVSASGSGLDPLRVPDGKQGDCFDDAADRPDDSDPTDELVPINDGELLDPDQVFPGADDEPYDGVDADCQDDSDFDKDGDGYDSECVVQRDGGTGSDCLDSDEPADCGDRDPAGLGALGVYPGAIDAWYDGTDANCDDYDDWDADYDGFIPDGYSSTYSGSLPDGDCDDIDDEVNPAESDSWYDGQDTNCSGNDDYDQDADGYVPDAYAGRATEYVSGSGALPDGDCDDTVFTVNPGRTDTWYDGVDTNCGDNDDYDRDGDGYVPDAYAGLETDYVDGSGSLPDGDCDDAVSTVNPGRTDTWYDGTDSNCSGNDDYDRDADGYVPDAYAGRATTYVAGSGSLPDGDCDDTAALVNPGRTDTWYDGTDTNCSGNDDYDRDGDGYVPDAYTGLATVYVSGSGGLPGNDCNDVSAAVNPAATEVWYDGTDQDCDDWSDYDADLDGQDHESYGGSDCNDANDDVYYGATETCSTSYDDDCDDDDNDRNASGCTNFNYDFDSDGYGTTSTRCYCEASDPWTASNSQDCNDTVATTYPGAPDTWYDGVDSDCAENSDYDRDGDSYDSESYGGADCDDGSASIKPGATDTWYDGVDSNCDDESDYDRDGDGFDWESYGGEDCDDGNAAIKPTATEIWYDGVDQDCDDASDYDRDGDGFDSDSYSGDDCNDASAAVNPDATETWYDGVDSDCSASSDYDADGDGDNSDAWFGGDCDDTDPNISSLEPELQDGADQDCDEWIDEDFVAVGDLVITEAMINSVDSSTPEQYEWIEVYNTSADTLYLDGWEFEELRDGTGSPTGNSFWISPDAGLYVDPGQYLVLCYRDDAPGLLCDYEYGANTYADSMYGAADHSSWVLANSNNGAVSVYLGGTLVDDVPFTASFPYSNGVSAEVGIEAMSTTANDDIANWCAATNLFATSTDGSSYGTPGEENDCSLAP